MSHPTTAIKLVCGEEIRSYKTRSEGCRHYKYLELRVIDRSYNSSSSPEFQTIALGI
ncbi:MAG: hypothetical protein ACMG55_02605 [Microcoleus sp.]